MKRILSILLVASLLAVPCYADTVITLQPTQQETQEVKQEISKEIGFGRLARTIENMRQVECTPTSIRPYELDPSKMVVTIEAIDKWCNGEWLVELTTEPITVPHHYWFVLYGDKYVKLGTCVATKIQKWRLQ